MTRFYRGSTIPLEFTHDDFPKADWTAKLVLKGATSSQTFDAVADPDEEKFTVPESVFLPSEIGTLEGHESRTSNIEQESRKSQSA